MCKTMCEEREGIVNSSAASSLNGQSRDKEFGEVKLFVPEKQFLVDNAGMIAFLGEIMFNRGIKISLKDINKADIKPRQRTDEVEVTWR